METAQSTEDSDVNFNMDTVQTGSISTVVRSARSISDATLPAVEVSATEGRAGFEPIDPAASVDAASSVLLTGIGYHVAATLGIVILALVGAGLALRNRLDDRATVDSPEPERGGRDVMTDREKIRRLVNENGGRMKQAEIVDSVEWSKAKVSRLLTDLESEGEITKLRLGRENLICLPGHEPAASRSSESVESE